MRFSNGGRARLTELLNKAERVVRLTPADVLVLTGIKDPTGIDPGSALAVFENAGIEARGLILLGEGMDVASIDVEELLRMDALTDQVDEGQPVVGSTSADGLEIEVSCPRCADLIKMTICASIQDTGDRMVGGASVDNRDLELHGMVCTGQKPMS